jgi:hypothetical protein
MDALASLAGHALKRVVVRVDRYRRLFLHWLAGVGAPVQICAHAAQGNGQQHWGVELGQSTTPRGLRPSLSEGYQEYASARGTRVKQAPIHIR